MKCAESALRTVAIDPVATASERQVPSLVEGRLYRLEGEASVDYPFRPNWRATGNFRRGVEYLAVLNEPVFSNGARVGLTGMISRRVDALAVVGYATAASAIGRNTQDLETRTGQVRVRYALRRSFAIYSEYLYYYYDLRGQARLAPHLPSVFRQHGIRVGLMIFETLGR